MTDMNSKPISSIDIIDKLCSEKMDLKKTSKGYRLLPNESNSVYYVLRNPMEETADKKEK